MPNPDNGPLVFYPSYCFKLSKAFNTWARLTASEVHTLEARNGFEGQNLFFHLNHPIRWVRLVGVIVAFDAYPNRIVMTLDDSSGSAIELFCRKETKHASAIDTTVDAYGAIKLNGEFKQSDDDLTCTTNEGYKVHLKDIDIGSVVKVKGGISEFRGEKQITLERIFLVRTTNEEASAWTENAIFYRDVLSKPWVVSEREQQQAKREAEGVEQEREARKERKRRRKEREEQRERKAKGEEERRNRVTSHHCVEKKQQAHKVEKAPWKQKAVNGMKERRGFGAKHPDRPAVSRNFDALGL
ncbi:MAG: hypothetical protein Q9179_000950 [Wetmoreana sp. 5 TL-2023]